MVYLPLPARYGLGDMERFRCEELAATLKWPCFALDVYGTGVRPSTDAEAAATMDELTSNPTELHARIQSSLDALLSLPTTCAAAGLGNSTCPNVDAARTTANGYCFGGQMVLELARFGGAEVAAVTSFHGELDNLTATPPNIQAVVSVHHAQLDFQGDEALRTFETEMEANAVAHWFTKYV
jgi:dienelactone hydrolase